MDSVNGYHATSPLKTIVLLSWRFKDALCKAIECCCMCSCADESITTATTKIQFESKMPALWSSTRTTLAAHKLQRLAISRALLVLLLLFQAKCECRTPDALPGNQTPPLQKPEKTPKLSFMLRRVKAVLWFDGLDGGFIHQHAANLPVSMRSANVLLAHRGELMHT